MLVKPELSVHHDKFPHHIINSLASRNITFWGDFVVEEFRISCFKKLCSCAKEGLWRTVCTSKLELLVLPDKF